MMLAVFIDQVKISDYGTIQYVKASEYKGGKVAQNQQPNSRKIDAQTKSPVRIAKRDSSHSQSKKRISNINQYANQEGGGVMTAREVTSIPNQEEAKRQERSKQWALDEKVSKKLNNIINKIHDHPQPVTTKNSGVKEILDFKPEKDQA